MTKQDFQSVFDGKPKKIKKLYLLALYIPNKNNQLRLGILIPKERVKRAIDRNLIRRIAKESFEQAKAQLKSLDIILLIRSECRPLTGDKADKKTLRSDIDDLWQQLANSYNP